MQAIRVRNLQKHYKERKTKNVIKAVHNISFDIQKGEIIGLLGPNGAGKTTTIKMICGLINPDGGDIQILGKDALDKRAKTNQYISAVLEGNRNLYWRLTVQENMEYFAGNRGIKRKDIQEEIEKLLKRFELIDKRNELVHSLSRGMQQKLAIAVALLAKTEIILLDEPTLGLDVEISYEVRKLIREIAEKENRTVIISSHDMPVIEDLCERVIIVNKGEIITDDRVENLLELFETEFYTVEIAKVLTHEQQEQLQKIFPHSVYEEQEQGASIQIHLTDSEQIYVLFDILKLDQTPIIRLRHEDTPFEQVFLNLVQGGDEYVATV
ncbi:MAG TPA: ABC transporter ATP-binding protein [Bacillota bacterium]|nr:ABC transporter ATP-binding protein [Bacillota bacterium]